MLDKRILELYKDSFQPSSEQTARTRALICSGPAFIKKDGKLVYSKEKSKEAYDKMYTLFLDIENRKDA